MAPPWSLLDLICCVILGSGRQRGRQLGPAHMYSTFSSSWEVIGTVKWCQTHKSAYEQAQTGFEPVLKEVHGLESSPVELSVGLNLAFLLSAVFLILFFMLRSSFSLNPPPVSIFKCCLISLRLHLQPCLLLPGISSFAGTRCALQP